MNEEFPQFPHSNDDDAEIEDRSEHLEEFPSEIEDDDLTPDIPAFSEITDADEQSTRVEEEMSDWLKEFAVDTAGDTESTEVLAGLEPSGIAEINNISLLEKETYSGEDTSRDEISLDEVSSDVLTSEDVTSDITTPEEFSSDEISRDDTSENELLSNDAPSDEVSSDEVSSDEVSSGEVSSGEMLSDDTSSEEIPSEEVSTQAEPFFIEDWLSGHMVDGDYHAILILKENHTWKAEGNLSKADIREIERDIAEAQKGGNAIDMARYVRLGDKRDKYLLYASTITGSLVLCTLNYSRHPLSEIRTRTRDAAAHLPITEEQIILPEVNEAEEAEEEAAPVEPQEMGAPNMEEAPQVMVDDLIREPSDIKNDNNLFPETDGWIFDDQEAMEEPVQPETVDESIIHEMETIQSVAPEESGMEEKTSSMEGEQAVKVVILPKAGYTRIKISKPAFGRLYHLTGDELSVLSENNILKPVFSGITKTEPGMTDPNFANWLKERYPDWKPAFVDVMAYKRAWLKNQKPAITARQWMLPVRKDKNLAGKPPSKQEFGLHTPPASGNAAQDIETWSEIESVPGRAFAAPVQDEWLAAEENIEEGPIAPPETLASDVAEAAGLEDEEQLSGEHTLQPQDISTMSFYTEQDASTDEQETPEIDETAQEDFIFLDESSDFLKDLSKDTTLEGIDQEQDATAFFEDYFIRSGETIEEAEQEMDETAAADKTAETTKSSLLQQVEQSGDDSSVQEKPAATFEEEAHSEETASPPAEAAKERASVTAEEAKSFDVENDYNKMLLDMRERFTAAQTARQAEKQPAPESMAPKELETTPSEADEFPEFSEVPQNEDMNKEPSGSPSAGESETSPAAFQEPLAQDETEFPPFDEEESPNTQQTVLDLRKIISNALSDSDENTTAGEASSVEIQAEETVPSNENALKSPKQIGNKKTDDILGDDLFPWEMETENSDTLEATPTPQSWVEADQSGDAMVDLLADAALDPVHLGFDQPMYTCILVPELHEFSLTNSIAEKIREWLPRLSRVFGWQFENILVQPTYLQWTVRVPTGTSQGSIVRKIRQQTSLRIFEEFPDLKNISQGGNFWAKGYLVVAGSNPPPAEFLDDFIQKNRKPSTAGNS